MKNLILSFISILFTLITQITYAQTFDRTVLSTDVERPWEITCGPDDFLWLTEAGGQVTRIDPMSGDRQVVYTALDYYNGLEVSPICPHLSNGTGTLGLALHPDFTNPETSFIYFVYSYNNGTTQESEIKFRIKQLKWDATANSIVSDTNIVNLIPTGYDHVGGRLLAIKQNNIPYLFLTVGDNGRSELIDPNCYIPESSNPNRFTQDVTTPQGKIHRYNMDGTVPADNPIPGNTFYTRGHRNPQGLMYNPNLETIYAVEHGDNTDDEINILLKGMNYGWKEVRGYHDDNSFPGEGTYVEDYTPHPDILDDALIEPLYSWCTEAMPSGQSSWCTVAPSGGAYYGSDAIPEWTNSLLVVTLKDGTSTDKEVYQFKLDTNGELVSSTIQNPNPKRFFAEDQAVNGRLRDIAISNDGHKIYLVNNGGGEDKIIVYDVLSTGVNDFKENLNISIYPNPTTNNLTIKGLRNLMDVELVQVSNIYGESYPTEINNDYNIDISNLLDGIYFLHFTQGNKTYALKFIKM